MSGPDRDPPTDTPAHDRVSNVVPIGAASGKRRTPSTPAKPAALPDVTGVAAMLGDPLLANLRESCLTDATIDAARMFTLPSSKWRPYGFRSARPQSGLFIPFFAPFAVDPYSYRLRPQYALPTRKGKPKKYDQPYGPGVSLVYTPPLAGTLDYLRDVSRPLYFTEGEKKALLLAQLGHCVVGLTGVDMFTDLAAKARGEGRKLHPYIAEHYVISGRACVIVFDADARSPQKPGIMLAAQKLAGVLLALGAISVHLCLPPDGAGAKGIDDYAHAHGLEACAALLASVRTPIEDIAPDLGCIPLVHYGEWYAGSGAEHLRMPRGYECDRDGSLWHTEDLARPDERKLVMRTPVAVTRELVDMASGTRRTEVRFRDSRGVWCTAVTPRDVLGDRSIIGALRPFGAPVSSGNAPALAEYLNAFEVDNGSLIARVDCVPAAGWHRDQFVEKETHVSGNEAPIILDPCNAELMRLASAIGPAPRADLVAHIEALRVPIAASPDCAVAVFAALAAPMLHLLDQPNFAVHLCGDSSRGKTSMLRIAASVFGDPFNPAWVGSWNASPSALESRAVMINDLPQLYDEIGAGDPEQTQRNVYMLANGVGRARATREAGAKLVATWRTVVISTGEHELASSQDATGVQARVISVPIEGFGPLGSADIDEAVRQCALHHGALGRAWLQWLVALRADPDELGRTREGYLAAVRQLRAEAGGDQLAQRTSAYFATMALVEDRLATFFGLGREGGQTVADFVRARAATGEHRIQPIAERVLDALCDWVASAPGSFPPADRVPQHAVAVCGYRRSATEVAFIKSAALEYLSGRQLDLSVATQRALVVMGALRPDGDRPDARMRVGGLRRRFFILSALGFANAGGGTEGWDHRGPTHEDGFVDE